MPPRSGFTFDRSDWKLNPFIFNVFKQWTIIAYGFDVVADVFASQSNAQLPTFGTEILFSQPVLNGKAIVYINGDWNQYDEVINKLSSLKVIAMIVAPVWRQHAWFSKVLRFATHFLSAK